MDQNELIIFGTNSCERFKKLLKDCIDIEFPFKPYFLNTFHGHQFFKIYTRRYPINVDIIDSSFPVVCIKNKKKYLTNPSVEEIRESL